MRYGNPRRRVIRYSGGVSQSEDCTSRKKMSQRAWAIQYLKPLADSSCYVVLRNAHTILFLEDITHDDSRRADFQAIFCCSAAFAHLSTHEHCTSLIYILLDLDATRSMRCARLEGQVGTISVGVEENALRVYGCAPMKAVSTFHLSQARISCLSFTCTTSPCPNSPTSSMDRNR